MAQDNDNLQVQEGKCLIEKRVRALDEKHQASIHEMKWSRPSWLFDYDGHLLKLATHRKSESIVFSDDEIMDYAYGDNIRNFDARLRKAIQQLTV